MYWHLALLEHCLWVCARHCTMLQFLSPSDGVFREDCNCDHSYEASNDRKCSGSPDASRSTPGILSTFLFISSCLFQWEHTFFLPIRIAWWPLHVHKYLTSSFGDLTFSAQPYGYNKTKPESKKVVCVLLASCVYMVWCAWLSSSCFPCKFENQ